MFGIVDTSQSTALGYINISSRRNAATLLGIIQNHLASGTTIHSDMYNRVSSLPAVASNSTVNHYIELVNFMTGAYTQNVESYLNRVKPKLKRIKGCHANELPNYLNKTYVAKETWQEHKACLLISALCLTCRSKCYKAIICSCYFFVLVYPSHVIIISIVILLGSTGKSLKRGRVVQNHS